MRESFHHRNGPLRINLLIFGSLFFLVLSYFYWQIYQSRQAFERQVGEQAKLVSQVVATNLHSAQLSLEVIEEVVTSFLKHTAQFVAFLDGIEPFNADELAAYVAENGLSGIVIYRRGQPIVMAPENWFTMAQGREYNKQQLVHLAKQQNYVLIYPDDDQRTIILGMPSRSIENLKKQMQVPQLLQSLSELSGIAQLRLQPTVSLVEEAVSINERRLPMGDKTVVLAIESALLKEREGNLWRQFLLFSSLLASAAVMLSWVLQRYQHRHTAYLLGLQKQLAQQREDASLGRAASTISHEVRNPLNAISMGLQRLQLESKELDPDHQSLIDAMCDAVKRTNGIVVGLQRFAQPLQPHLQTVAVDQKVQSVVALYRPQAEKQRVAVACTMESIYCRIDDELLGLLLENLVKNALEAQPNGGFVHIVLHQEGDTMVLTVENSIDEQMNQIEQCLEPYYTTKTRGTGLGLTMVNKIAVAHGGDVTLDQPDHDCFRVEVRLPLKEVL